MAEQIIDTLVTVITANTDDFNRKAEKVRNVIERLKYDIQDYAKKHEVSFKRIDSSVSRLAKRFLSFYAIIGTGRQVINQALAYDRLSRSINMNVEDVQAWSNVLKQEGGSLESFSASAKKLSNQLNAIPLQGNSPLLVNLNRLGINAYSAGGGIKSVNSILLELSSRLKGMSGAQAMSIGKMLGLDDAMVRTLQKGRRELNELLMKNKEVGVYNSQMVQSIVKLNKTWQELKQTFMATAGSILGNLAPLLQWLMGLAEKISVVVKELSDNFEDLKLAIEITAGAIALLKLAQFISLINKVYKGVGGATTAMRLYNTVIKVGGAIMSWFNAIIAANPFTFWITVITLIIGALYLLFNDIRTWLKGGESMFGSFYQAIANGWHWIEGIWRKGMDWLGRKIDWIVDKAKAIGSFFHNLFGGFGNANIDAKLMGLSKGVGASNTMTDSHNVTTNNVSPIINVSGVQDPRGFGQSMMTGMTENLNFGGQP